MCPHVDDIPLDKSNAVAIETDSPHIPMPNGNSNVESSSSSKDASTLPPAAKPVHQQQKKNAYGPRYSDFLSNTSNWSVSRFSFPLLTKSTSGEREFSGGARGKTDEYPLDFFCSSPSSTSTNHPLLHGHPPDLRSLLRFDPYLVSSRLPGKSWITDLAEFPLARKM